MFLTLIHPYRIYLVPAGVAFFACLLVTPLVRWLATRVELVDRPDNHRKLHASSTALGGGLAVLIGFFAAGALVFTFSNSQRFLLTSDLRFVIGLAVASTFICCLGLADDRWKIRGRQKLVGQAVAASILVYSGLWIQKVEVFGLSVEFGVFAVPFTLFWLLGAINSLNLMDGMDGLATSIGLMLSLAIGVMAIIMGRTTEAFLALAMAGALAGFLIYNAPPATIFLGDAGSMLIGLTLGALAIRSSLKGPATAALAAPAAIWAVPIIDAAMAILRRKLTGRSIYTTDRGHLHHRLQHTGLSGRMTVCLVGVLCLISSIGAIASVAMQYEWMAYAAMAVTFGILVITGIFGRHELLLLGNRSKQLGTSFMSLAPVGAHPGHHFEARLQGNREWDELWETLTRFAHRFDLSSIQLNVQLPAMGEEYHAAWRRREQPDESQLWQSEIPLKANNTTIGRLRLTGACCNGSVCAWMGDLIAGLQPFETQMLELIGEGITDSVSAEGNGKHQRAGSAKRSARRPSKAAPRRR